ncbi:hypothetical protein VNO77_19333 [Canavalia gladiata]|uniref:Uncharacterized protein n=1 Tax=Canavalia gladiata TaxID=3824 RepID=A0AAN9QIE3_CANGL
MYVDRTHAKHFTINLRFNTHYLNLEQEIVSRSDPGPLILTSTALSQLIVSVQELLTSLAASSDNSGKLQGRQLEPQNDEQLHFEIQLDVDAYTDSRLTAAFYQKNRIYAT